MTRGRYKKAAGKQSDGRLHNCWEGMGLSEQPWRQILLIVMGYILNLFPCFLEKKRSLQLFKFSLLLCFSSRPFSNHSDFNAAFGNTLLMKATGLWSSQLLLPWQSLSFSFPFPFSSLLLSSFNYLYLKLTNCDINKKGKARDIYSSYCFTYETPLELWLRIKVFFQTCNGFLLMWSLD